MTPILPPPHAAQLYQLWLVWLVIAVALLMAKPWGVFGWDEWLVIAVPLLLILDPVRPLYGLICGLAASSLAWTVLSDRSGGWTELAFLWGILAVGTIVGFTARRGSRDGQPRPGFVDPMTNQDLFLDALNRELCRARRGEGSFAVLSVDRIAGQSDTSLRRVCDLLDAELRVYADIAQVGERVLALVPEVRDGQYEPLLQRLMARAEASDCGGINIGLARFPQDAVCANDLIDVADRKRLVREVSRSSGESYVEVIGQQMTS